MAVHYTPRQMQVAPAKRPSWLSSGLRNIWVGEKVPRIITLLLRLPSLIIPGANILISLQSNFQIIFPVGRGESSRTRTNSLDTVCLIVFFFFVLTMPLDTTFYFFILFCNGITNLERQNYFMTISMGESPHSSHYTLHKSIVFNSLSSRGR